MWSETTLENTLPFSAIFQSFSPLRSREFLGKFKSHTHSVPPITKASINPHCLTGCSYGDRSNDKSASRSHIPLFYPRRQIHSVKRLPRHYCSNHKSCIASEMCWGSSRLAHRLSFPGVPIRRKSFLNCFQVRVVSSASGNSSM